MLWDDEEGRKGSFGGQDPCDGRIGEPQLRPYRTSLFFVCAFLGGMRRRSEVSIKDEEQVHFSIDPIKAGDCRVRPVSPKRLSSADLMRSFVRLYPAEKLRKKDAPESWEAMFVLRSGAGVVEARQETKFVADGGSGYLAFVEIPLGGEGVQTGPHTLEVETRGPGIHGALKQSRQISISAVAH